MSIDKPAFTPEPAPKKSGSKTLLIVGIVLLLVVGTPVCICGGCIAMGLFAVNSVITGSEPYTAALTRAQQNPEVQQRLGEPITAGMTFTGNINLDNDDGDCDLSFPISGPNGEGTVSVRGERSGGVWTYSEMAVTIDGETIDLNR